MDTIIILEENYVRVVYVPKYKLVKVVWNGTVTSEQYQRAFTMALDFQEKGVAQVHNFLSDIRNQGIVNPENRKWFETYAIPRAIKQGLKRGAVIFDGNIFKKYYLNLILQSTNHYKLPFKFFSQEEDALNWFSSFGDL
jgi:hypothetical protein